MSGFSADWLALREPCDAAARALAWPGLGLAERVRRWRARGPGAAPLRVIDLACGTGSNLRALAPHLGGAQQWLLVDHDPALLQALPMAMAQWAAAQGWQPPREQDGSWQIAGSGFALEWRLQSLDLARQPDALPLAGVDLVTGSALLDLVSARWLDALLQRACAARAAVLFALNVDGRTHWEPADPDDEAVHALFSRHQGRDKGFGPALAAAAVPRALQTLAGCGYAALALPSDWRIDGAQAPAMLAAMVDGMAAAAQEQDPAAGSLVRGWRERRRARLAASRLTVGHLELLAEPPHRPGPDPTAGPAPSDRA